MAPLSSSARSSPPSPGSLDEQIDAILASTDQPDEWKIRRLLRLGVDALDLRAGYLSRVDPALHTLTVVVTCGPDSVAEEGAQYELGATLCRRAVVSSSPIALHDVSEQGSGEDPAVDRAGIESYLSTRLIPEDRVYGALCFTAPFPNDAPFTEDDLLLVETLGRAVEQVLATKGKGLDADGRKLLEEDLRSPCTEEVAVFHAFSKVVREAARGFVVLDTAPTGHTLLLLDQTGAYHREVVRTTKLGPGRVTTPLMRLQDPAYTRLLVVTLPETTPVLEAAALQADLGRAGIAPFAWVVNQSLAAADPSDPLLAARAAAERPLIEAVEREHAECVALLPVVAEEPVGAERLLALARGTEAVPAV